MSGIVGTIVLDVIEQAACDGCFFQPFTSCHRSPECDPDERTDGKSVIFKARPEVSAPPRGRNDCPACGSGMLLLATQKKKICVDCCVTYPWELDAGQKPLVSAQR
jgi:hypothetical protein